MTIHETRHKILASKRVMFSNQLVLIFGFWARRMRQVFRAIGIKASIVDNIANPCTMRACTKKGLKVS